MKKKNIVITFLFFILSYVIVFDVAALSYGGCEYSQISRLKSFVSNINISYDYYILDNKAYFNITLNNIVPGMYFVDSKTGNIYNYSNTIGGEITLTNYTNTNGRFSFYSELSACYGVKLGNKYYNLPNYNTYYVDPLCDKNRNSTLCQKWSNVNYSYSDFKKMIDEYNQDTEAQEKEEIKITYEKTFIDILVKFYTEYYYFVLIGIIVICNIVIIINKKKNRFDI